MKFFDIRLFRILTISLFVSMAVMSSGVAFAQSVRNSGISSGWDQKLEEVKEKKKTDRSIRLKTVEPLKSSNAWIDETRYFEDIRLDSLWFVGVGDPIPERRALKMDTVYRLSMKLDNGKYIRVQSLRYGSQVPSEKFYSLLLPAEQYDYDDASVTPWMMTESRISDICQYPSLDNKTKSAEVAYDAEGNVMRSASVEFPIPSQAIVIYYDSKGNIVNLTPSTKYEKGTIVIADFNQGDAKYSVTDIGGWPIVKIK